MLEPSMDDELKNAASNETVATEPRDDASIAPHTMNETPEPTPSTEPPPQPAPTWSWSAAAYSANEEPAPEPPEIDLTPTPPGTYASEPITPTPEPRSRGGSARSALVGGLVGALVGALVAGGLVVAFDDDPEPAPTTSPAVVSVNDNNDNSDSGNNDTPPASVAQPGDIPSILDAVRPAVVAIDVVEGTQAGTGTGFIVDSDGVIVTNAHVVGDASNVTVHLADGRELEGDVVGAAPNFDLAVVQVDETGLPTLVLGDSDEIEVGDPVVAIGNALGRSEGSGATVTTGIVSGLDRIVQVDPNDPSSALFNALQTDAAINPGNSGGPLVDSEGRVIGINTAIADPAFANNIGFAISISSAKPIIEDLRAGRDPQVPFLGVATETVTPAIADEVGVDQGAVITEITSGSAADEAGLQDGDVIVAIAGESIDRFEDVASQIRRHQPGDNVEVTVVRDGDTQKFTVTLTERPDE